MLGLQRFPGNSFSSAPCFSFLDLQSGKDVLEVLDDAFILLDREDHGL
jgi:hypothetical protein